jgi:hypothetical protein
VKRLAAVALSAVCLAGCGGGGGGQAVAHVGGDTISRDQLEAVVTHFRGELQREGRTFPKEGTTAFKRVRDQLLGLLVYRTELKQAARRLGVEADPNEIGRRLAAGGGGEQEGSAGGDTFAHDSVEAQLLAEGIYAKVTRGVRGASPAQTAARKNRRMTAFLARLRRETKVSYEPGYAPGS